MRQRVVVKRIDAKLGYHHVGFVRLHQWRDNGRKAFQEQGIVRPGRKRQIHRISPAFPHPGFLDKPRARKQKPPAFVQ